MDPLFTAPLSVHSLCVSQQTTCCLRVLIRPVVTTHAPPAGVRAVHLQYALIRRETHWRREEESFFKLCLCDDSDRAVKTPVFALPGKVVFTVTCDTHVVSSSPPAQSFTPSQALAIGMNFTELVQKKYLLSISSLTGGKGSGAREEQNHR